MKNEKVLVLSLRQALKPNVEQLYQYDKIFIPLSFKQKAKDAVKICYAPLGNVYSYEEYGIGK